MGHAEAAAGVGSLSKVIIAMETGFIPPNINISSLRNDIDAFKSGRIKVSSPRKPIMFDDLLFGLEYLSLTETQVVTEKTPWNGGIVGVSGFGMGGANTHAILKSFSKEKINHGIPDDYLPRIVCVSGRTEEAVDVLLSHVSSSNIYHVTRTWCIFIEKQTLVRGSLKEK